MSADVIMVDNIWTHVVIWLSGGLSWRVISYAMSTVPKPKNQWALWVIGCVQYTFANITESRANFRAASEMNVEG